MAGKLKGQGKLKGFFLLHGEKLGIAVVALAALWLVYKTTSLPRLEEKFQAAKLQSKISETNNIVQNATWPDPGSEKAANVRPYTPIGEKADQTISSDVYVNKGADGKSTWSLDSAPVERKALRPDPVLINAVDVRARGGSGLFSFMDEEVRKRRDLERAREEAEKAAKEAEKAAKEAENAGEPGGEGGRPRRRGDGGEGGFGEGGVEPFDPAHPKRRPLDGTGQALGIPLQGGERIEQAYWAIVTAKVPIREQLKLFQDAFEKAKGSFDPMRDFPQYKGYFVQRAEVVPGKELEWKPVPVYAGERKFITAGQPISANGVGMPVINKVYEIAAQTWAGQSPDVIDSRFADYILTFPLPPLVGRNWGPEATHPDIPLIADTPPLEEELSPLNPQQGPEDNRAVDSPFAPSDPTQGAPGFPGAGGGMGRGMGGSSRFGGEGGMGMGRRGGMGGPEAGGGFRPRPGGAGFGGEEGPRGGRGYGGGGGPAAGVARTSLPKGLDFLLLRFFDFTVEPGKKYKYRVQLVLADPNFAIPKDMLSPEVRDRHAKEAQVAKANKTVRNDIRRIETWSDPSPTVGIPLAGNVHLVDVKPASNEKINDEPAARLLVEAVGYDEKNNAIQASVKKEKLLRGHVANMTENGWYIGEGWVDEWKNFKFVTGMTIVDIDGGKQLTRDYSSPGRLLVMGPAGELYIRDEIEDKPAVDNWNLMFDEETRKKLLGPAGGGFEGGPGGMGRPPRGGGMRGRGDN
jgi:hypothetical protein